MSRKPLSVALLAGVALVLFGASYALGRSNFNPFSKISFPSASKDTTAAALALQKRCSANVGTKSKCYGASLDSMATRGEVRSAMRTLAMLSVLDADAARDGHEFAHAIGMAAGKSGGDIAKIFSQCDESNQSGCYHGVLQSYLVAKKQIGPEEVNGVCQSFRGPQADRWILFQCVHGTGHGLTMYYNHDLPRALKDCDYLSSGWDQRSCYAGAFMENIVNEQMPKNMSHGDGHEGMDHGSTATASATKWKALDKDDLLYPCSKMAERYLPACYEMQTAAILYLNGGDIKAAAKTCDTAPNSMPLICYQSLGRDISAFAAQNHATAIEMCGRGTPKYQPWCYFGLVKSFVNMNARAEDGVAFCRELKGEPNKLKCYEAVGEQIGTLRNDVAERSALCQSSEAEYKDACLFGARVGISRPPGLQKLDLTVAMTG